MPRASVTSSVRMWSAIDQPMIRRESASSTAAQYTLPSSVGCFQYDFGDGPVIAGRPTVLFCAWLAWSRYRIVIALRDRTVSSVFAALDALFRLLGAC